MTQAITIIRRALAEIGVLENGQAPDAEDAQLCLTALNALADSWRTAPNYAYTSSLVSATLDGGTQSLTIGPGQAFNTTRPVRLSDGCYVRVSNIDYPLQIITEAQYNEIGLKDQNGPWPSFCYYDGGSPTGNVFFWPTGSCTVYLNVETQLGTFANLTTDYTLPPGYERAYGLTLAEEIAPAFARVVTPGTMKNAANARRAIKRANVVVPQLAPVELQTTELTTVSHDGVFDGGSA